MIKELSKQLCELCGVEPKIITTTHNNFREPIYPDFGKSSNFVKLLELLNNQAFSTDNFGFSIQKSFVKQYLDRFIFEMQCDELNFSDVKQAIKNTEWEY